jgi:hypothetical protein
MVRYLVINVDMKVAETLSHRKPSPPAEVERIIRSYNVMFNVQ